MIPLKGGIISLTKKKPFNLIFFFLFDLIWFMVDFFFFSSSKSHHKPLPNYQFSVALMLQYKLLCVKNKQTKKQSGDLI